MTLEALKKIGRIFRCWVIKKLIGGASVLPARCVRGGLNRARNISLYDLLTDLSTRAGGGDIEVSIIRS